MAIESWSTRIGLPPLYGSVRLLESLAAVRDVQLYGGRSIVNPTGAASWTTRIRGSHGAFLTIGSPVDTASLRPLGMVRVTAVAGVPVPATAAGSFMIPDVTISSATAVPVDIEAVGIPPGTVVTLQVYPQTPDNAAVIFLPPVQTTLDGTTEHSTATVEFAFPYGFSRGTLRATW